MLIQLLKQFAFCMLRLVSRERIIQTLSIIILKKHHATLSDQALILKS